MGLANRKKKVGKSSFFSTPPRATTIRRIGFAFGHHRRGMAAQRETVALRQCRQPVDRVSSFAPCSSSGGFTRPYTVEYGEVRAQDGIAGRGGIRRTGGRCEIQQGRAQLAYRL